MRVPRGVNMFVSYVLPMAVAFLSFAAPPSSPAQQARLESESDRRALSRFFRAVDEYMLTRRLIAALEPDTMCLPEEAYSAFGVFVAEELDALVPPQEGDVFSDDVADRGR